MFLRILRYFLVLAICCLAANADDLATGSRPKPETNEPPAYERVVIDLTTNGMSTLKLFGSHAKTSPPWLEGNGLTFMFLRPSPKEGELDTWVDVRVVNIHSENLKEITRRLGIKNVEVAVIPTTNFVSNMQFREDRERPIRVQMGYAVITDARIPREWFYFHTPIYWRNPEKSADIQAAFPLSFRPTSVTPPSK